MLTPLPKPGKRNVLHKTTSRESYYKIYIPLLHMSKEFDTVNRNQMFETLEEILFRDEIHLLHILTNDVKLKVRVGADYGPEFRTSAGIMQSDCPSAVIFMFYLAKAPSSPHHWTRNIAILIHPTSHVKHQLNYLVTWV